MMRRTLATSLALLCLAAAMPNESAAQTVRDGRIRVLGRAVIETVPDYAIVSIGVSNKAATPTATLDQNSAVARKLIEFAKKFGIDEGDIQTDAVNLRPATRSIRDRDGNVREEPDGYTANNTVRVKLTDLAKLGTFVREVLDQGANNIAGLGFGLSNANQVAGEARTKAVEDALQKAEGLAQAAKVRLGKIQEIVYPPQTQAVDDNFAAMRPVRRGAVPIATGTVSVVAEVLITWAIE